MKRYFLASSPPSQMGGEYHYVQLASGQCAVVLVGEHIEPDPSWVALPGILDTAPLASNVSTCMGCVGVAATDSTFNAARKLGAIHPKFRP